MKNCNVKFILMIFIIFSINSGISIAQISAFHGIVYPYDRFGGLNQSIGETTGAQPDFISDPSINPGLLSFFKTSHLFANVNLVYNGYQSTISSQSKYHSNKFTFFPEQFTGLMPLKVKNQMFVVSISANKIPFPEYEVFPELYNESLNITHERKGTVWKTSLGLSTQLFKNFGVGVSLTKWFGEWKWRDTSEMNQIYGEGDFLYHGKSVTIGFVKQFENFSVGLAFYTPFTLMKSNDIRLDFWGLNTTQTIKQQFQGGVKFGGIYQTNAHLTLGFGYRYQNKILMENVSNSFKQKNYYGVSHQLVLSSEYKFQLKSIRLPVFTVYQANWVPDIRDNLFSYQTFSHLDKKKLNHSFTFGLRFFYEQMTFYLTNQINFDAIHFTNHIMPPYS